MDWLSPGGNAPDPGICRRCADVGPTCCVLVPGEEELRFPVAEVERHRLGEHLGLDRGAFTLERNSGAFRAGLGRLFPREGRVLDRIFPDGGVHARVSTDRRGRCLFLRRAGCLLPRQVRPYYCRLFPFWVTGDRVTVIGPAGCLARREGGDAAGTLALLDCAERAARDLHGRLRLAWGLPPEEGLPGATFAAVRSVT